MKMGKVLKLCVIVVILLGICGGVYYFMFTHKAPRPNVLFIIADTLRGDHLACYGNKNIKTPNIDGIAARGTLFENTFSQAPLTLPSHCSLFTSTYPQYNGVRDNGNYRLDPEAVTLAERLKENGYETGAFVSTFVLDSRYGLEQGFDTYDDEMDKPEKRVIKFMNTERRADKVTANAIKWLKKNKDERFFLWVHYYDPHTVYDPPSPYKEEYKDNLYDGEIAYTDEYIGHLLSTLKNLELDKNTLIVFLADHGESLGQHNESGHAVFVYDATLKVPLMISWPGVIPEGKRVSAEVSLIDVMPTILDLVGLKKNKEIQGTSLYKLINGKDKPLGKPIYSESLYAHLRYNWSPLQALRIGEWKYIQSTDPELFNVANDPGELKNLATDTPAKSEKMEQKLEKFLEKTSSEDKKDSHVAMDEATKEKLMSLGYIQGTPDTDGFEPVPRDMIAVIEKMNLGDRMANSGMVAEAIKTFQEVLKADPDNMEVYSHLGQCYKELKQYTLAAKCFKKAASFRPDDPMVHDGLGNAYKNMGMINEAYKEFMIAHELDPEDASVINNIGWCFQQKREFDKAMEYYDKALELEEDLATTHANMAICYRMKGDTDEAIKELNIALVQNPDLPFAHAEMCACIATRGDVTEAIFHCQKAIELDNTSFDGYNNLGVCYEMTGEYESAIENYKKAIEIQPWNTLVYNNTANSYLKMGNLPEARKYLQKSLELNPDDKEIARVLGEVDKRLQK